MKHCPRLQKNYDALIQLMSELIRNTSPAKRDWIVSVECALNLPEEANHDIRDTLQYLDFEHAKRLQVAA